MNFRRFLAAIAAGALLAPVALVQTAAPALADETVSTRVDDGDPIASAISVAQLRFAEPSASSPAHVVLSRSDVFADSLSGSALLGKGPLLFTDTKTLSPATRDELVRLRAGVTRRLYVLGGPNAVSTEVESAARSLGYDVVRLAGANRIETSIAIADQAFSMSGSREVLLARAYGTDGSPGSGWVDSVAGGARAANNTLPVLLTRTEALDPQVGAWLRERGITSTSLLGGPGALSVAVEQAVPGPRRFAADERTGTAAAIARGLWGAKDTGPRAFTIVNGSQERGWAFGLAAAGLAADRDAPVLLTLGGITPATRRMVATCGAPQVDLTIIGDGTLVSGAEREYLDDLDGEACGADRTLTRRAALTRFESCVELIDWYRTNALERVTAYGLDGWYGGGPELAVRDEGAPTAAPEAAADQAGSTDGQDVSGTNVQEVGVDEPDILKTDGDLVAIVAQDGSVDLLDLTGINPRVASNLPAVNEYGQTELLLHGNVLTTLTTTFNFLYFSERGGGFAPGQPSPIITTVTRWNVSLPDAPVQLSQFEMDGQYRSARMIDGVARIVLESSPQGLAFTYPSDDTDEARNESLEHNREVVKASTLDNWLPSWGPGGSAGDGELLVNCSDVNEPPVWSGFDAITVVTLDTATDTEPGATATVVAQGQNVYASLDRLLITTGRWGQAFEGEQLDSEVSTEVHAFDISQPTTITYVGSGRVNGYVINQFALSEFGGDIRIAATKQPPWGGRGEQDQPQQRSESFVSVLQERDDALVEVGRVDGLGLGEQIQAVRFYGDLGIVVTFRQVDPLYLLDMSNSGAPVVTGELKDTGFSQYLHRVGPDLLMGVGVDADIEGRTTGAMVSLYDISDRSNPTRVGRYTVDDSYSPVGNDHKAFLYWGATGDAFVPISTYGQDYREVATVLRVDGGNKTLAKRGDLDHAALTSDGQPSTIRRTFIVGPNVYSLSYAGLARHDLETLVTTSFTALSNDNSARPEPGDVIAEPVPDPVA
ncbi:MAG: hypothetical protein ACI867_001698 [Glaciecola sp.]|jgi:hypothetical protein